MPRKRYTLKKADLSLIIEWWPAARPIPYARNLRAAPEELGRVCYAMELLPAFVDVAVARWEAFTGQQATIEATNG